MKINLPADYLEYLRSGDAVEFQTDHEFGGYIILEPQQNLEGFNKGIEIEKYAPGLTAFGSDGGGEVFVFDNRGRVFLLPLIGMAPDEAVEIADSWASYLARKV